MLCNNLNAGGTSRVRDKCVSQESDSNVNWGLTFKSFDCHSSTDVDLIFLFIYLESRLYRELS